MMNNGKGITRRRFLKQVGIGGITFALSTSFPVGASSSFQKSEEGGTVTIPIVDDPLFNPWHPRAYVESIFVDRVLFTCMTRPSLDYVPSPNFAKQWEISEDGLQWTFELHTGVIGHDGKPFTAEDVAWTYETMLDPELGSTNLGNFVPLEDVEVLNSNTVRFTFSERQASLPAYMGYNAGILPKRILEGKDPWTYDEFNKKNPVGSGPYKMKEYVSGSYVILERHDQFFRGRPKLDKVIYKILPDPNTQVAQLLAGELSLMIVDRPSTVERLEKSPRLKITTFDQFNYFYLMPNLTNPLFKDKRVRQALLMALNRQEMIDTILFGYGKVATGPISPALKQYYTDDVKTYYYDPEGAKELLSEAGWKLGADGIFGKNGMKLSFTLSAPRVQTHVKIAQMAQEYWNKIGLEVKLETREFNTFISELLIPRNFEITTGWWVTPPTPDHYPYYHSSAAKKGNNFPQYSNKEVDKLLEEGRKVTNVSERTKIYKKFQRIVAEELPYLYLWYPKEIRAMDKRLHIPPIGVRAGLQHIEDWYVTKS